MSDSTCLPNHCLVRPGDSGTHLGEFDLALLHVCYYLGGLGLLSKSTVAQSGFPVYPQSNRLGFYLKSYFLNDLRSTDYDSTPVRSWWWFQDPWLNLLPLSVSAFLQN